jgi:tetratricopeptide (TPR) repeat protein
MNKPLLSIVLFFCFFTVLQATAQSIDSRSNDIEEFKEAENILIKSTKEKDPLEAEKLYLKAFSIYPVLYYDYVHTLPYRKIIDNDLKSANRLWEVVINSLRKYPQVISRSAVSFKYLDTKQLLAGIYSKRALYNSNYGDVKQSLNDFKEIRELVNLEAGQFLTMAIYANEAGDFETSRQCVDSLKKMYAGKDKLYLSLQLQPIYAEAAWHLAKGEFTKVLPLAERLITEDKGMNTTWRGYGHLLKAEAFANIGRADSAKLSYDKAIKRSDFYAGANNATYIRGLIFLVEKDYQNAIASFTRELNFKTVPSATSYFPDVKTRYRYYTKRAEAHLALGNFVKARQDYQAALIYNADFEPAISGLIRLESSMITERKTDKEGPKIIITEPAVNRGLKVSSSGTEVMIKGKASDASGLKGVSLNGIAIYAQEDGVFWGSLPLRDGINKVTVKAIDMAGNPAEQVFEIEKQTAPIAVHDVIPVQTKEAKNYALVIAAQNYDDSSIPSLENPVSDAIRLKLILKKNYNFSDENFFTLLNPVVSDFKKKFLEIQEVIQPEDNLIIFYAGHGIWVEKEKKGYWLLTDAQRNDPNSWLSNKLVLEMIAKVPSRHTLLITDACFSGSVFKTRSIGADAPIALREMSEKISRVAITSGNDTEVPDESVFMKYLVKALSENKEKYLTAQKMFITQIIEAVMTESKTEPRYGTLELAGHVGGDFIFSKK